MINQNLFMLNANLKLGILKKNDIHSIQEIWHESLPDNLKSIIGQKLIGSYLIKFFEKNMNLAVGLYESNKVIGFVLFGNNENILNDLFKEKFLILRSFFSNLIKLKFKYIYKYIDVLIYIFLSNSREKVLKKNSSELIIIKIKIDKKNKGYGTYLIKNSFNKFNQYFSKFDSVFVKTLRATPENISFYKKNNFEFLYEIFGRVYLRIKSAKNY